MMANRPRIICLWAGAAFPALLLLASCSEVPKTREEIQQYISDSDNGLLIASRVGDTDMEIQYKPTDFLVDDELYGEPITRTTVDSLRKKYAGQYYFVLRLSNNEREALYSVNDGNNTYSELVQRLSFDMGSFVTLTTQRADTIRVADFALDRTHGLGDATTLIFVFERPQDGIGDWIQFNIGEFGLGVGNQRFRFQRRKLDEAPAMDFGV